MTKRIRRKFSKEYKAEVVTLIRQGNKSIGAAEPVNVDETLHCAIY